MTTPFPETETLADFNDEPLSDDDNDKWVDIEEPESLACSQEMRASDLLDYTGALNRSRYNCLFDKMDEEKSHTV
jgi:hypothetical protein